jgi:DNA repair exonuclease SbcCD ATPase subunit
MNDQTKKIEALTADVDRLQKQNADLQLKADKAAELAQANAELSKARGALNKQVDSLIKQLNDAKGDAKAAQSDVHMLKATLATRDAAPAASNDKALQEKFKELKEKKDSLEAELAEWTELAKVRLCFIGPCEWLLILSSALTRSTRTCCQRTKRQRSTAKKLAIRSHRSPISSTSLLLPKPLSPMV